ncbi:MAG TPA: methyltransferase domain-containing protein, partial [bacterium]|nr:methyltransferase domain-containing protein [bacterium]
MSSSTGNTRRLFIWAAGDVIRTKIDRLNGEWEIVRFASPFRGSSGADRLIDASGPLPFGPRSFDALYARRIVEHLAPDEAKTFANEARRLLEQNGVLRISVPDMEALARDYLAAMDRARAEPRPDRIMDVHEKRWLFIDQFVRRVPGGALGRHIATGQMTEENLRRAFGDALGAIAVATKSPLPPLRPRLRQRAKEAARLISRRRWVHETHASREAHLWIYDRFSLPRLLRTAGFSDIRVVSPENSAIDGWERW